MLSSTARTAQEVAKRKPSGESRQNYIAAQAPPQLPSPTIQSVVRPPRQTPPVPTANGRSRNTTSNSSRSAPIYPPKPYPLNTTNPAPPSPTPSPPSAPPHPSPKTPTSPTPTTPSSTSTPPTSPPTSPASPHPTFTPSSTSPTPPQPPPSTSPTP